MNSKSSNWMIFRRLQSSVSFNQANPEVRVRFAPSPTGSIHLGGLRTAFYNYIFAKKNNGRFILRIEDTDRTRLSPGSEEEINYVLNWAGLKCDESPSLGGNYGPYRQSERLDYYQDRAHELIDRGKAYRCFCSHMRLELLRNHQARNREKPRYDGKCRDLTPETIKDKLSENNSAFSIRFKLRSGVTSFDDMIFGSVSNRFQSDLDSDPIILKSDGYPTYHFANIVDDRKMKISHVLRGSEWLSSTCKHVQMYQAFDWPTPIFGHFPLITMRDKSKMSKRNNQSQVKTWIEMGYRPLSLLNFLINMGGGVPKKKQDAMDLWDIPAIIEGFDFKSVNCNSGSIDLDRLRIYQIKDLQKSWQTEPEQILKEFYALLDRQKLKLNLNEEQTKNMLNLFIGRIETLNELISPSYAYLWSPPKLTWGTNQYQENGWNLGEILRNVITAVDEMDFEDKGSIHMKLKELAGKHGKSSSDLMRLLRLVLTNSNVGLPIHEILNILGKDRVSQYLECGLKQIS